MTTEAKEHTTDITIGMIITDAVVIVGMIIVMGISSLMASAWHKNSVKAHNHAVASNHLWNLAAGRATPESSPEGRLVRFIDQTAPKTSEQRKYADELRIIYVPGSLRLGSLPARIHEPVFDKDDTQALLASPGAGYLHTDFIDRYVSASTGDADTLITGVPAIRHNQGLHFGWWMLWFLWAANTVVAIIGLSMGPSAYDKVFSPINTILWPPFIYQVTTGLWSQVSSRRASKHPAPLTYKEFQLQQLDNLADEYLHAPMSLVARDKAITRIDRCREMIKYGDPSSLDDRLNEFETNIKLKKESEAELRQLET